LSTAGEALVSLPCTFVSEEQTALGSIMTFPIRIPKFLLYAGIGTIEWVSLVAIEAIHNSNWSGDPYVVAILISALVLGIFDGKTSHFLAGGCLIAPALCLALWTTPKGDNDGLWMLIFPILSFIMPVVILLHQVGATIRNAIWSK
jgi:hypothetical protein